MMVSAPTDAEFLADIPCDYLTKKDIDESK
jgi:hypothetical protein